MNIETKYEILGQKTKVLIDSILELKEVEEETKIQVFELLLKEYEKLNFY